MLMVGAGKRAPHQIRAHCAVRPSIGSVKVWIRSPDKARRLAESLDLPIAVSAVADLE
jgi:ornithine cyclodeaminase